MAKVQKITPFLWFDKEAAEAAKFYTSIFKNSKVKGTTLYPNAGKEIHGQQAGSVMTVSFELDGYQFIGLNAGPLFKFNPSISFILNFDPSQDKQAHQNLDKLWAQLSQGGKPLMPLQKYPFSEHYGWIQDKYGISWQLMLTNPVGEKRPFITPSLMFVGPVCGKAEAASNFYLSVFKNAKSGSLARYPQGMEPDKQGTVMFRDFMLENQWFACMDSARMHDFNFNEAISLLVNCHGQKEVDYYWGKLSADPKAEQCGWLKDKYGVSWQIVPVGMEQVMNDPDPAKAERAFAAMLKMKKLDLAALQKAAGK